MQIQQLLTWPAVNWPGTSASLQYTVTQLYPTITIVDTVQTNSAVISYDDSLPLVFQVRPTSGTNPNLVYGPEVMSYVNQFVPCRAYIRQLVRKSLADRVDKANANPTWPDDEIDNYIYTSMIELNQLFPVERDTTITLVQGLRNYPLPTDLYSIKSVAFISLDNAPSGKLQLYLKEKPWRGGESTATSYLGYPKLGILISPLTGRFYPGHYYLYESQIWIDWDPMSINDTIAIQYAGKRVLPVGDADILQLTPEDIDLVSLRAQMMCWLRIEGSDTKISRWRTKEDGGSRADMPTVKMSSEIQKLYNSVVIDRKEKRPVVRRLVRR
jgi:hypothetical protein